MFYHNNVINICQRKEFTMAKKIGFAVQSGKQVKVYDENNSYMFSHSRFLPRFTPTSVAVTNDGKTSIYDNPNCHQCSH